MPRTIDLMKLAYEVENTEPSAEDLHNYIKELFAEKVDIRAREASAVYQCENRDLTGKQVEAGHDFDKFRLMVKCSNGNNPFDSSLFAFKNRFRRVHGGLKDK